jgi:hypothetical protein
MSSERTCEPAFRLFRDFGPADTSSKHSVNTRPTIATQLYLCRIVQIVLLQSVVDRPWPRRYLNGTPSRDVFSFSSNVGRPLRGSCTRLRAIS